MWEEEEALDQLSDESWNKIEAEEFVADLANDEPDIDGSRAAFPESTNQPFLESTDFPNSVEATETSDNDDNADYANQYDPEHNDAVAVAAAQRQLPPQPPDIPDAVEPDPVMSPTEITRAKTIVSTPTFSPSSPPIAQLPLSLDNATRILNLTLPPSASKLTIVATNPDANNTGGGEAARAHHMDASPTANFASVIRERTKQRRQKDAETVATLKVQVERLEKALAATCRRRVDSIQAIQNQATAAVMALEERLSAQVATDMVRVHGRLTSLEQRMAGLETRWSHNVGTLQDDLQHSSRQLAGQLQSLHQAVAQERTQATARHDRFVQQMHTVATSYDERWQQERQDRLAAILTLQETMQAVHSARELDVATMEGQLAAELRALTAAVAQEQHERRAHDEDIVQSLNRYTRYIQESLAATTGIVPTTSLDEYAGLALR
jgi:SF-assemblin/beta giardin